MDRALEAQNALVFSYLTLRKAIGILGFALPFAVALGALIIFQTGLQGSISGYYYTGMRDVLVGSLWATAFFLLAYKGYGPADDIAGDVGCLAAVGITLFPTAPDNPSDAAKVIGAIHLVFGALFFLTLIYFSLFLFTKKAQNEAPTLEKLIRNRVYRGCGIIMAACIVLVAITFILPGGAAASLAAYHPVFVLETIAIWAFGVSWLTKGEAILKDQTRPAVSSLPAATNP